MAKIARWPKILNSRNPFSRLYSAWNDKASSFPVHENGSITFNGIDLMRRFSNRTEMVMFIQQNTHKYNDRYFRQGYFYKILKGTFGTVHFQPFSFMHDHSLSSL